MTIDTSFEIHINQHSPELLYQQIADGIRQLIATGKLKPGDRLPTIRRLASTLNVNQNTVVRAYLELEREQVIVSRRGGGTTVAPAVDDAAMRLLRQRQLSDMVSNDILKALSLNYSPEEVEAAFHLHMARWREGRQSLPETGEQKRVSIRENIIRITGSHDLALSLLIDLIKRDENIEVEVTHAGSLGGLIALQENRAHLAGIHLLDEETGEYNYPYVRRIMPGREVIILHLAYRIQGLMFLPGNPKQITGLNDLRRADVVFANRQLGSGTRVLLDLKLRENDIPASLVKGYEHELDTHLAVGQSIANQEADTGLGIAAAARSCRLDFLPLFRERYDLVTLSENYRSQLLAPLIAAVTSSKFRELVNEVGGYDTSEIGKTITV